MSDSNPYQSPGECDQSSMPPTEGWPKTATVIVEESDTRIAWDRFLKWKEQKHLILLYRSSTHFLFVPVEKFEPEVADAIRACLRTKVPE